MKLPFTKQKSKLSEKLAAAQQKLEHHRIEFDQKLKVINEGLKHIEKLEKKERHVHQNH